LSIFIAFAPGLAACMAWMLVHFDAPLKWSVNWNKSRLDALASQVIAGSEGAERPDQIIGGYSLRHIRKESGGFVCVIQSGFVKDWGFAYFSPPAGPPANLFCTPLGNGWYYWKE
ncbi:MAG TPA: hypothetical protein VHM90_04625, partial [Phycisphaerae bacterium]|nr:hypothetical protein [Phycisphaerae bacterium]